MGLNPAEGGVVWTCYQCSNRGVFDKDSVHGPWHVEAVVVETCGEPRTVKYSSE